MENVWLFASTTKTKQNFIEIQVVKLLTFHAYQEKQNGQLFLTKNSAEKFVTALI